MQRGFGAVAILMLGYCGFVMADTWKFQNDQNREFARLLDRANKPVPSAATALLPPVPQPVKGLIGRLEITRLGLSVMVMEGTDARTLRRAAGHISGTAFPGGSGNIGISGHRDTLFRPLKDIRQGDAITIETLAGVYSYHVISTSVVSTDNVSVLNSDGNEILTLVTCYPFYFVGPAPNRFVVRAERDTEGSVGK